jgi:hypothetical protein
MMDSDDFAVFYLGLDSDEIPENWLKYLGRLMGTLLYKDVEKVIEQLSSLDDYHLDNLYEASQDLSYIISGIKKDDT